MSEESVKNDIKISINYMIPGKYTEKEIIEALNNDIDFVKQLMKDRGAMPVIERLPEEVLNSNPELYFIAVDKQPQYLHNVPKEVLQNNPEAYITVIKKDPHMLYDVPKDIQEQYPEEVMEAVKNMPSAMRFMDKKVQEQNPEFVIDIVKETPGCIKYLAEPLKKENPQLCVEACKKVGKIDGMGIPDEVLIANPELVIELAEKDLKNKVPIFDFDSLPKELMQNAKIKELSEKQSEKYKELNEKNNGTKEVEDKHPVEVKTSKFKEFYDKSKGKLKQAFDKLKEIFGKDKQVDISKENDDEIKQ